LNRWNREVFGNVEVRKKALLKEIQVLDGLEDERVGRRGESEGNGEN
jgi:hypothetical protein